ncbi:ROK family protein [Phototrophicus methaneseepsis]|uniref:ROK family protein n=1 Tax=Phototrophicus methaneseepsis TaxID=2710758 RepID=A0A7S8E5E5_9CHLR|nr:ROK family protein [Phototrophicus methaneseepsis]QPC80614.1 ROK family protein [Phototrophicus methaneseepsis]
MSVSGNALIMKEININLVRRALKATKRATKHQIAQATGLSTVTVATILQELADNHEVFEDGFAASSGGRPAQCFCFNENHAHTLILFTHEQDSLDMLYLRIANLFGECIYEQDTPLPDIKVDTFEPYIEEALLAYPSIRAIGFGLPGVVLEGKFVQGDYPALIGADLVAHYQERYQRPVLFENDVNAACVGYSKRKTIDSENTIVYLYFPQKYAPGAGIYLGDALHKGYSNHAGEIGGLPFGVNWFDQELYRSLERISEAIAQLIIITSSLLNPQSLILYGTFLTDAHIDLIQQKCAQHLYVDSLPTIRLTRDFTLDYQTGMIEITLALLEPQLSISS